MTAIAARIVLLLLLAAVCRTPWALAQESTTPKQAPEKQDTAQTRTPAIQGSAPGPGFPFLGVDADARIDPTRKGSYEDFQLDTKHLCTGCWCNNVFGNRLSESWNELVGKSPLIAELWQEISRCIDPLRNRIPQIRTVPLEAMYDDLEYAKVIFYFSEFLDKLLATRVTLNSPQERLEGLRERFGEPESIEDIWYIWQRPGAVMLLDLFNVLKHDREQGELLVIYDHVLLEHIAKAREVERITR